MDNTDLNETKLKTMPHIKDVYYDKGRDGYTGDPACIAEFKNVSFVHSAKKAKTHILHDFSLKLYPGKIAAVAALRSTDYEPFINLILRSYEYPKYMLESGSIIVGGENTSLLSRAKAQDFLKAFNIVAPAFGAGVTRRAVPDEVTVKEFVSQKSFLKYYELEELSKNLKIIGFYDIDALFESNYNTLTLSDKQRVKLAQDLAYAQDVAVIAYPAMSLNGESKYFLQRLLHEKMDGGTVKTILLLAEDVEFVGDTADYIVVIDEGQVIAAGTTEEIIGNSDNELVKSMLVKI